MTEPMTDERLAAIAADHAAYTTPPQGPGLVNISMTDAFHALGRLVDEHVPALLAEVRILRAAVEHAGRGAALAARHHRQRAAVHALQQLVDFHAEHLAHAGAVIQAQADALAEFPQHEAMAAVGRVHAEKIRGLLAVRQMWTETKPDS